MIKTIQYYPQPSKYWPEWVAKQLPSVFIRYYVTQEGENYINGIELPNVEAILFRGNMAELFEECRESVARLNEPHTADYHAFEIAEELENGEAEREREAQRVNDYYENELLID